MAAIAAPLFPTISQLGVKSIFLHSLSILWPNHSSSWSWQSLWNDITPSILWAVPKKKTSHSRKRMRSANKGLKDRTNIVNCPGCGGAKLAHHICPSCYSQINRWRKERERSQPSSMGHISLD